MRIRKLPFVLLVSLLAIGLTLTSGCNYYDNNRDLARNTPDGLQPYTYDGDFNGDNNRMNYNRFDNERNFDANRYNGTRRFNNGINRFNNDANRYGYMRNDRNGFLANRNNADMNQDSERMANIASRVNGVDRATVVIAGRVAYVGINLDDSVQNNQANTVESNVQRSLRKFANKYNVRITSDQDLFGRLRDIGDGIRNGTPVDRYRTDFEEFGNRFRTNFR